MSKANKVYVEGTYALLNLSFLEKNLLYPRYRQYVAQNQCQVASLSEKETQIIEELEETGICLTSLEALGVPDTDKFLKDGKEIAEQLKKEASLPENQGKDRVRATAAQYVQHLDLYHWGLQERLLDMVEAYLKVPAAYSYPTFALHIAEYSHERSGNWHRDREDRRMVKIGVYLSDVDEDSGPFQYVRPDIAQTVFERVQEKYPLRKTYKTFIHKDFENIVGDIPDWLKSCTGPAGTVIFFDPVRLFHRGMPPNQFNRLAIFFGYHSRRPSYPLFCSQSKSHFSEKDLERLKESLSERQRACIDWHKDMTGFAKFFLD